MRVLPIALFFSGLGLGLLPQPSFSNPSREGSEREPSLETMLRDFAEDFRTDPTAREILFGIEVHDADQKRWHVYVGERLDGEQECPVEVVPDFPPDPVPYFVTDLATIRAIHRGELASLTAMGKAFSTDFAPLDLEFPPDFQADEALQEQLVSLSFHFWTRGYPERIRFGDMALTRPMHGGHGVLFYYQEGFRSGYIHLQPGEHANADPRSQTNPFPTLFVLTRGSLEARIGQTRCKLTAGEAIVIGPGVHHEFWVAKDAAETAEGVLLMFGDGA